MKQETRKLLEALVAAVDASTAENGECPLIREAQLDARAHLESTSSAGAVKAGTDHFILLRNPGSGSRWPVGTIFYP